MSRGARVYGILQQVAVLSTLAGLLAQILEKSSAKAGPYAELLKRIERVLSGKPLSTEPLEAQLDQAVEQLMKSSRRVAEILSEGIISISWGKSPNELSTSHFGQER